MFVGLSAAAIDGAFAHPAVQAHLSGLAEREVEWQATPSDSEAADLARLKERNRRLEALVAVLREGKQQQRTGGQREQR